MESIIYFTRHGRIVASEDMLSEEGKTELVSIRKRLSHKGFKPLKAFTTLKNRTVESAACLAPEAAVIQDTSPRAQGTVDMLRRFHADRLLDWLLPQILAGEHALVVNHDSVPAVLALRLIEQRGVSVPWTDPGLHYRVARLQRGQGVLVCGTSYEFIVP